MTQSPSDDPIVNAVLCPQGSRFVRFVLKAALANQGANPLPSEYGAGAQALFANLVMNDILNLWNIDLTETASDAQNDADQVISGTVPTSPAAVLALAYHARGLAKRKLNDPNGALSDFQKAVTKDPNFARGYAQIGNQMVLNKRSTNDARAYIQTALDCGQFHPACGYFFWNMGRAFFVDQNWNEAITWLCKSVNVLQTVWYNYLYLAAAQQNNQETAKAIATLQKFIDNTQFGDPTLGKLKVQPYIPANPTDPVIVAFRNGLQNALNNMPTPP